MNNAVSTTDFPAKTAALETDTALANVGGKTSQISFQNIAENVELSALETDDKTLVGGMNELKNNTDKSSNIYTYSFTDDDLLSYGESPGSESRLYRTGNVVKCHLNEVTTKANYGSSFNPLLRIPDGYKPYGAMYIIKPAYSLYGVLKAQVHAEGDSIKFISYDNASYSTLSFFWEATWITNDEYPY